MIVLDVLESVTEYQKVQVLEYYTSEILSEYDGKNSIDEKYNCVPVSRLETEDDTLLIYINNY